MFCTKCGSELHEGDRFCANCGAKVRDEEITQEEKPKYEGIVYNPPFKLEAERRTAEIEKARQAQSQQNEIKREPVNFDWNLEGFPEAEPKKSEDVDFNWGEVVERRRRRRQDDVVSPFTHDVQETPTRVTDDDPMFRKAEDTPMTAAELEKELFGPDYKGLSAFRDDEMRESTAQLEKFYTYNQKKEAFQALLDQEYARLQNMEEARKPDTDSLDYTWAERLFPGSRANVEPPVVQEKPPQRKRSVQTEVQPPVSTPAQGEAAAITADPIVTMNRPEASSDNTEQAAEAAAMQSAAVEAQNNLTADTPAELMDATIDFSAVRAARRQTKQMETPTGENAEDVVAVSQQQENQPPKAVIPEAAPTAMPQQAPAVDAQQASTANAQQAPLTEEPQRIRKRPEPAPDRPVVRYEELHPEYQPEEDPDNLFSDVDVLPSTHQEKSKLRYSDVFPKGFVDDGDNQRHSAAGSDEPIWVHPSEEKEVSRRESEEDTGKMSILVKLLIVLLAILIVAEGILLVTKFIAPDSAFSQKTNELIETVLDKITGGDDDGIGGNADPGTVDVTSDTDVGQALAKIPQPATIGEVAEAASLKYNLSREYAFEEIAQTTDFTNATWRTGDDGNKETYADGIVQAIVTYYDDWQGSNKDQSLIGINKLEIGEIRTGVSGYYTLCRLTFATSDNTGVLKYSTVHVLVSGDSAEVDEVKEETL